MCDGVRHHPSLENQNAQNFRKYDMMMGTLSGIDNSNISLVVAGRDAVEIQYNNKQRSKADIMG